MSSSKDCWALGIGANTAIFSFMDAILLRALPVRVPETWSSGHYPFPAFEVLRANNTVLSSMFAFADAGRLNLSVQGQIDLVGGQFVSGSFRRHRRASRRWTFDQR